MKQTSPRSSRAILVVVILFAAGFLLWRTWLSPDGDLPKEAPPSEGSEERAAEETGGTPFPLPVVAADKAWSEADEAELQALVRQLEGWDEGEEFSATVGLGETLVTDGFEKAPGVFVFATLTPERYEGAETQPELPEGVAVDEEAVYLVSVRQFEVDVSGGESMVSAPRVLVKAGHEASIQYSTGTMTGEGEFRGETTNLEFLTERESDQAVRLSGSHSIVEESIRR